MSANNQTLVREYKGKWVVFPNMNAESWSETNDVWLSERHKMFDSRAEALAYAHDIDSEEWSEYGVHEHLAKDGADVTIHDSKPERKD